MRIVFIFMLLVLSGCATPSQVKEMIEANNQTILEGELVKIRKQIVDLTTQIAEASEKGDRTLENIRNMDDDFTRLKKTINTVQTNLDEIKRGVESRQEAVEKATADVDLQKRALIEIFREQLGDLENAIRRLEEEPFMN